MKAKLLFFAILFSTALCAQEAQNAGSLKDLSSFKWGMPSKEFLDSSPNEYEKPYQDKGANLYISKNHIMIEDIPFKQIVKLHPEKGLTSINYMNISNKDAFEGTCKKILEAIDNSFSKPKYQSIESKPQSSFYVWPDIKETTMYEFCFSESALQTIIITVEPKWKVIECALDDNKGRVTYLYDEANSIMREYAENYISNALKVTINLNNIEFTSEKNASQIIIDPKTKRYTVRNAEQKLGKGHCEMN